VNRDVRSVGRSMGLAFASTAGIAVMVAAAVSPMLFRSIPMPSDVQFPSLVDAYLGNAGDWVLIGNLAFACAALLILTFGAVRVSQRLAEQFEPPGARGRAAGRSCRHCRPARHRRLAVGRLRRLRLQTR